MIINKRSRGAPSSAALQTARDVIARETCGLRAGGLRCDLVGRLSEEEQKRLVELVDKAGQGRSWAWSRLSDRERRDLEDLIEKAADMRGAFTAAREIEEIRALADQAHVKAVRRPLGRKQENGIFSEAARCIEAGWMDVADLAILASFLAVFVGGRPLGPRSRVERVGEDTVLVVDDVSFGPFSGAYDPEAQIGPRWQQNLGNLEANEWLSVERHGKAWTVSPGARLRAAMAGKPIRDVVAA
jgi:hypothetical protein